MQVASLENSKKLYELSGWDGTAYGYSKYGSHFKGLEPYYEIEHRGDNPKRGSIPAYDLGYLLRKLPFYLDDEGTLGLWADDKVWEVGYYMTEEDNRLEVQADTPEDAAALLAIKLIESGILTAPSPDKEDV